MNSKPKFWIWVRAPAVCQSVTYVFRGNLAPLWEFFHHFHPPQPLFPTGAESLSVFHSVTPDNRGQGTDPVRPVCTWAITTSWSFTGQVSGKRRCNALTMQMSREPMDTGCCVIMLIVAHVTETKVCPLLSSLHCSLMAAVSSQVKLRIPGIFLRLGNSV